MTFAGTPLYMSPEIIAKVPYDCKVYSIIVIIIIIYLCIYFILFKSKKVKIRQIEANYAAVYISRCMSILFTGRQRLLYCILSLHSPLQLEVTRYQVAHSAVGHSLSPNYRRSQGAQWVHRHPSKAENKI